MSCYNPILLSYDGLNLDGNDSYKFEGIRGYHTRINEKRHPKDKLVPCRKCIGCRLDYSRHWADRLMLELDHSKTALFLTLTYDDEHITPAMFDDNTGSFWYTLVKRDLQLFNKRLREYFIGKEIRFYAVGEYGSKKLRPHYHGIYFGLSLSDFSDRIVKFLNKHDQPIYVSDKLSKIWKNGIVSIGNVSWQSCAYVARYSLKKLGNSDLTASRNCLPEFSLMSRRPGIAGYFPIEHPEIFDNPTDKLYISDPFGVKSVNEINMPKFIFEKLSLVNPELYDKIKLEREIASTESFLFELSKTRKDESQYLYMKEWLHEKRVECLVRA